MIMMKVSFDNKFSMISPERVNIVSDQFKLNTSLRQGVVIVIVTKLCAQDYVF